MSSKIIINEIRTSSDKILSGEVTEGLFQIYNIGVMEGQVKILKIIESTNKQLFLVIMDSLRKTNSVEDFTLICALLNEVR